MSAAPSATEVVGIIRHAFADRKPPAGGEEGQASNRHPAESGAFDPAFDVIARTMAFKPSLFSLMRRPRPPAPMLLVRDESAAREPPASGGFDNSEVARELKRNLVMVDAFDDEERVMKRHLAGLGAFDLTFDVVESTGDDPSDWFALMELESRAYYLPSFMIMAVEDFRRSNWGPFAVLHAFRYWPLGQHEKAWAKDEWTKGKRRFWSRRGRDDRAFVLRCLHKWFHVGHRPWPNERLGYLTDREQRAVLAFFEYLEVAHPNEFGKGSFERRNIAGAKAMLSGGDLASRLAVRGRAECLAMREVLHILCQKYPNDVPAEAEEIARELTLAADRD